MIESGTVSSIVAESADRGAYRPRIVLATAALLLAGAAAIAALALRGGGSAPLTAPRMTPARPLRATLTASISLPGLQSLFLHDGVLWVTGFTEAAQTTRVLRLDPVTLRPVAAPTSSHGLLFGAADASGAYVGDGASHFARLGPSGVPGGIAAAAVPPAVAAAIDGTGQAVAGLGAVWMDSGQRLFRIDPRTGARTTVSVGPARVPIGFDVVDPVNAQPAIADGSLWVAQVSERLDHRDGPALLQRVSPSGGARGLPIRLGPAYPLALAAAGGRLWVVTNDERSLRQRLWQVDPRSASVTGKAVRLPEGFAPTLAVGREHALWLGASVPEARVVRLDLR
jgi:hypothetical protein